MYLNEDCYLLYERIVTKADTECKIWGLEFIFFYIKKIELNHDFLIGF